jgi:hypothetical protein
MPEQRSDCFDLVRTEQCRNQKLLLLAETGLGPGNNSMIPEDQIREVPSPQFAQVHLSDNTGSAIDADLVIRHDSWTLEVKNSASPALLAQILQMVMRSV